MGMLGQREPRWRVHVCFGPNCERNGSKALYPMLTKAILDAGLTFDVEVVATSCRNRCDFGPSMNVYPGPFFYNRLTADGIERIVREHLAGGVPVTHLLFDGKTMHLGRRP